MKLQNFQKKNKIVAFYNIPKNFTEKNKKKEKNPQIKSHKREEGGNITSPLEIQLNNEINNKIKEEVLLSSNIIENREELYKYKGGKP